MVIWLVATQIFFIFTPKIGKIMQFDETIFQMGWNHQLDGDVFPFCCFSFFYNLLYSLENWHISWNGWKMFLSFWNGPFSGDVYIFGGFKVLWRFDFSVKVYLAWFLQIRLASFLRLFLHFLVQKRWEHWEIVIMDSSNNETTTHVFFNRGIPHYIRFLGCICVVCCFMSFLVCLFFLLALWVTFFLRGFGLFGLFGFQRRKYNSSRMVIPGISPTTPNSKWLSEMVRITHLEACYDSKGLKSLHTHQCRTSDFVLGLMFLEGADHFLGTEL